MKITRDKALPDDFSQYETKQYPIHMGGGFNPILDLNQFTIRAYSSSKITFTAGDGIYELRGSFGSANFTKLTDLLNVTSSFTSLTQFQTIEGTKTLRLFIEKTSVDPGFGVDKLIQGFEDGDLFSLFSGNDEIYGTNFTNGSDNGGFGTVVTGDLLSGLSGNDKIYGYGGNDEIWGGSGNDQINGGSGNDALMGGSGRDQMAGGAGNDVIYGGSGIDAFVFDTTPDPSNTDTVADFIRTADKLLLDDDVFTKLKGTSSGLSLDSKHFGVSGKQATGTAGADDYFYFRNSTLYYDADGNGAGAGKAVVTLTGVSSITASDIQIIA